MWFWAISTSILLIIAIFIIINLMRKYERLEEDSEKYEIITEQRNSELAKRVVHIDNEITAIDERGSFEADDEVGTFFKRIKELRDLLKEYIEI